MVGVTSCCKLINAEHPTSNIERRSFLSFDVGRSMFCVRCLWREAPFKKNFQPVTDIIDVHDIRLEVGVPLKLF